MALKSHKPTTPSMRHTVLMDKSNVSKKKPEKKLTKNVKYNAGRSKGRITMRHKGGRVKRLYRYLDFLNMFFYSFFFSVLINFSLRSSGSFT